MILKVFRHSPSLVSHLTSMQRLSELSSSQQQLMSHRHVIIQSSTSNVKIKTKSGSRSSFKGSQWGNSWSPSSPLLPQLHEQKEEHEPHFQATSLNNYTDRLQIARSSLSQGLEKFEDQQPSCREENTLAEALKPEKFSTRSSSLYGSTRSTSTLSPPTLQVNTRRAQIPSSDRLKPHQIVYTRFCNSKFDDVLARSFNFTKFTRRSNQRNYRILYLHFS
ncbi:hypothetical protein H6P81_006755 [Aristolochia fimbriata]|uniref:Uncharacterized protein n=1 Tax=Aristolochia fimbriata TaxID=158543 RepID=A0AAV7F0Y1_ARIFI|nr:hypothetical protein H6P81_006755 [Aristolochia fimbriata]